MISRVIDEEVKLIKYYPNYKTALEWYQDMDVCKQKFIRSIHSRGECLKVWGLNR